MGQDFLQNHVGVLVAEGQTRGRDGGAKAHPHERRAGWHCREARAGSQWLPIWEEVKSDPHEGEGFPTEGCELSAAGARGRGNRRGGLGRAKAE